MDSDKLQETRSPDADGEADEAEQEELGRDDRGGRGTWKHAAFHVATTIATPAAYAPLPFALSSLGWPLGNFPLRFFFIYFSQEEF